MAPQIRAVDHIHVLVADRVQAEAWVRTVLGLERVTELDFWATDGGPLMVRDTSGTLMLALFEGKSVPNRSTIVFRVNAAGFREWRSHLERVLPTAPRFSDHDAALSLYFDDPFGNPFEITCYDQAARSFRPIGPDADGITPSLQATL